MSGFLSDSCIEKMAVLGIGASLLLSGKVEEGTAKLTDGILGVGAAAAGRAIEARKAVDSTAAAVFNKTLAGLKGRADLLGGIDAQVAREVGEELERCLDRIDFPIDDLRIVAKVAGDGEGFYAAIANLMVTELVGERPGEGHSVILRGEVHRKAALQALTAAVQAGFASNEVLRSEAGLALINRVVGELQAVHQFVLAEGAKSKARDDAIAAEHIEQRKILEQILANTSLPNTPADPERDAQKTAAVERAFEEEDPADIRAIREIADGNVGQGLDELEALARKIEAEGKARAAQKWRDVGALAYDVDPARALVAYREAHRLDPTDFWAAIYLSRLEMRQAGDLVAAKIAVSAAGALAKYLRELSIALNEAGTIAIAQGRLDDARALFDEDLGLARQLQAANPSSADAKRDVSVSLDRLGDVAVAQGRVDDARALFDEGLGLRRQLQAANPSSADAKRDVSVLLERLGDVAVAQGRLDDAQVLFDECLGLRRQLQAANPSSADAKRDVAVSCVKLGNLSAADADIWYRKAFEILGSLRKEDRMLPRDEGLYQALAQQLGETP